MTEDPLVPPTTELTPDTFSIPRGWLLVPSIALNYEMDTYAGKSTKDIKGKVTGSTDASTSVEAKTFGSTPPCAAIGG